MADLDALAERAVAMLELFVRKGAALVTGVMLFAACAAAVCLIIASQGLSGSARSAALFIGIAVAVLAVGAAFVARWRLGRVRAHSRELVGELRILLDRDDAARRTVIETVDMQDPTGNTSVMVYTRQFDSLKRGTAAFGEFTNLNRALIALTSLPWLIVLSLVGTLMLGALSFIYAIAWLV